MKKTNGAPRLAELIIKYSGGMIKNEQSAIRVLLVLVTLSVLISFFLLTTSGEPVVPIPPQSAI